MRLISWTLQSGSEQLKALGGCMGRDLQKEGEMEMEAILPLEASPL